MNKKTEDRLARLEKEIAELKKNQIEAKDILEIMKLIGEAKKEYVPIPYPVYPQPQPYYPTYPYWPYGQIWTTNTAAAMPDLSATVNRIGEVVYG